MRSIAVLLGLFLLYSSPCQAADLTILSIRPVFKTSTPGFGEFSIEIEIRNNMDQPVKASLACLYIGLTSPGVYFKDQPKIQKQYQIVEIQPLLTEKVVLKKQFRAYHPETLGEIIITVVGAETVKSIKLRTAFHPGSQD